MRDQKVDRERHHEIRDLLRRSLARTQPLEQHLARAGGARREPMAISLRDARELAPQQRLVLLAGITPGGVGYLLGRRPRRGSVGRWRHGPAVSIDLWMSAQRGPRRVVVTGRRA